MNKNTVIAILLIVVILFGFSWYNNKQYTEQLRHEAQAKREQFVRDSTILANAPKAAVVELTAEQLAADSLAQVQRLASQGELAKAAHGEEQLTVLENELMKITFSSLGGRVAAVELKDYKKYNGDPLMLFNAQGSSFGLQLFAPEQINTGHLYFETHQISDSEIAFRLKADSLSYLEYRYSMKPDNYMIDFTIDLSHFKGRLLANQPDIALSWNVISPQEEKGFQNENNYTTIAYKYPGANDIEELGMGTGTMSEEIPTKVEWVSFKQQFFSSIIVAKNSFNKANVLYNTFPASDTNIKDFQSTLVLPYGQQTDQYDLNFYFGPNKFSVLNQYEGLEFQKLVPLGWGIFGWINRWLVIPSFDFLGGFISNYGIVILLLTLFIKLLILPLTYKSYLSTAKMRLLKPDIDKINERYPKKDDAMKKQQAMMEVYRQAGVSPMGGCLPMLIQFPILIAMFRFFPASIELRQKSFLWADDLSSYDSILNLPFDIPFYGAHVSLFTLLMAVSLYISSRINYAQQPMGNNQMPGMKFMMLYMMPAMLLLWFNNYSSGLSYYYLLSNIITIGQTYGFRYFVDDKKLHQKMRDNAKAPKKKSKWAERMEQMQKQAAAQQQAQKKR